MSLPMSSLNPHAASYIPLNKGEKEDKQKTDLLNSASEGTTGTEQFSLQGNASSDFTSDDIEAFASGYHMESDLQELLNQAEAEGSEMYMDFLDKNICDRAEVELAEKYLEFLEVLFPNISKQCLADVFCANHCDLEASVNMLKELESSTDAASKPLPALNLDTGDESEFEVV